MDYISYINEFLTWDVLRTLCGAVIFTVIFVDFTKDLLDKVIHIPTKLYAYLTAVSTLGLADIFIGDISVSNAFLNLFNGIIIAVIASSSKDIITSVLENFNKKAK